MNTRQIKTLLGGIYLATVTTGWAQRPAAAPARSDTLMRPAMVARGDSIFHGMLGGGSCSGCHGVGGKGVPGLTPDMTSGKWLNGDGSFVFIVEIIERGVPHSKQTTGMMPPKGGAPLEHADVRAVAAYVYSLTHPRTRSGRP